MLALAVGGKLSVLSEKPKAASSHSGLLLGEGDSSELPRPKGSSDAFPAHKLRHINVYLPNV